VWLAATAEGLTGDDDAAFLLKVPRKNGMFAFEGDTGSTVGPLETSAGGVCLDVEPYAGGAIESIAAVLTPLPAVVSSALDPSEILP
jgi:hypothetical protein